MRKLPDISEMQHITSKELGEKLDTILDRVTEEDIAFVVDHEGKPYVLCPAHWFSLPEMEHIELVIKNAVRYVATVDASDLKETVQMVTECASALSYECISQLLEIASGKENGPCSEEWLKLRQVLETEQMNSEKKED